MISRIRFLVIKKSISWCQEINFISWYQEIYFLISRNEFLISRNQIFDIKKYSINSKTAPQNTFLDIKKSISWYHEIISWYQEFDFWYQGMCIISWYQEFISWYQDMHVLISRIRFLHIKIYSNSCYQDRFLDIKKSNSWYQKIFIISWYQEIEFLISRNRILDIKKCWINSKTAPHIKERQCIGKIIRRRYLNVRLHNDFEPNSSWNNKSDPTGEINLIFKGQPSPPRTTTVQANEKIFHQWHELLYKYFLWNLWYL